MSDSNHDPLCPQRYAPIMPGTTCGYCVLISDAANRERERMNRELDDDGTTLWHIEYLQDQIHDLIKENGELKSKPNLGLATNGQLLEELRTRIEIDYYSGGGGLNYTTVNGRPDNGT